MKNKSACIECKNEYCLIRQGCFGDWLESISNNLQQFNYKDGNYIFREGETIHGVYFIGKGAVKVVTASLHGREQVVRLAKEGQILGHKGIGKTNYYFNAIALADTRLCFVDNDQFYEACTHSPEFAFKLMVFYASELRRAELRVKYQAQMNIREKVAMAFVYSYELFGIDPATMTLNIKLNRQGLADIAGTTAQQVSRQLGVFEHEKLIARRKREIIILNIKGLENIVKEYQND